MMPLRAFQRAGLSALPRGRTPGNFDKVVFCDSSYLEAEGQCCRGGVGDKGKTQQMREGKDHWRKLALKPK